MSLVTRYRLFWAALTAALLGLAFWKNSRSYPRKSPLWRLGKAVIDAGLVMLMVIHAPALLLMYVVIWLTSPFRNKIVQVSAVFASILAITHLAGVVFEAVAVLGVFAVDLLSGQVVARMDKRGINKLAMAA
jgi:glycerol-3-phosphate acyltransferase PlsY